MRMRTRSEEKPWFGALKKKKNGKAISPGYTLVKSKED